MSVLLAKPVFGRVNDGNAKRTDVKAYEKKGVLIGIKSQLRAWPGF